MPTEVRRLVFQLQLDLDGSITIEDVDIAKSVLDAICEYDDRCRFLPGVLLSNEDRIINTYIEVKRDKLHPVLDTRDEPVPPRPVEAT